MSTRVCRWSSRRERKAQRAKRTETAAAVRSAPRTAADPDREPGEAAILAASVPSNRNPAPLSGPDDPRLTPILALDCEMVGVGASGQTSALAQVCVVNQRMETVYMSYVRPKERVTGERKRPAAACGPGGPAAPARTPRDRRSPVSPPILPPSP